MPSLPRLISLLRNLFRKRRVERELDDELRSFLEMSIDEKKDAGLTEEEARRAALLEVQGIEQVKELVRGARAGALAEQMGRDLSLGLRMLSKSPGFTAVAVATLALGIGANTGIFSLVDTIVFRPLPYEDPGHLVKICGNESGEPLDDMSLPDLLDVRAQGQSFAQVAADDGSDVRVTHADGSRESVLGAIVTANWLSTLGVRPILGRGFLPEDEQRRHGRVALLGHDYWRRRFAADPDVAGRTLVLDGEPHVVIGVLPPNVFRYDADFLMPLVPADYPPERSHRDLDVFARLRPGVSLTQAQAEIVTIAARLAQQYPATNHARRFSLVPLGKHYAGIQGKAGQGLVLMWGAVGLVLLIACANVANLLLARSITRYREWVVRAALGATRGRLVRQMLAENIVLFLLAGTLGVLLARWSLDWLRAFAVANDYIPERMAVAIDGRVLAFSLIVSLVSGLLFGLAPALQASRVDPNEGLRDSSPALSSGFRRSRARRWLVVSELALTLVLLVGTGLLTRSFLRLQAASGGVDPENLLETSADAGRSFLPAVAVWREALEHVRALPGVESAAVTSRPPVHFSRQQQFVIEGQPPFTAADVPQAGDILISADYFRTMGIPLLKGRAFGEDDTHAAPPVVIISESLARRHFGEADPIGRRVSLKERLPMTCCTTAGPVDGVWREVVGVVADIRQANLDAEPAATLYRPYTQIVEHDMFLMVRARSRADATALAANLGPRLRAIDPNREWTEVQSMRQVFAGSESFRLRRFVLLLLGGFAGMALILATVGLYGVMAYSAAERTREIGIRVALGATPQGVVRQILGEAMSLTVVGLAVGSLAALALTRCISSMLFGVGPTDAATYLGVSFLLAGVALLATYLPARRAARIDPVRALRHD
jgi:predicted permease